MGKQEKGLWNFLVNSLISKDEVNNSEEEGHIRESEKREKEKGKMGDERN